MAGDPVRPRSQFPRVSSSLLRVFLPRAERDEVLSDLEKEDAERVGSDGVGSARRWVRRQTLGSLVPLVRRGWFSGTTGFEPRANRMQPGGLLFESWIKDARYAARRMRRRPLYTALAVLTLALGAGGTAAIYSITQTLLLDPLPIAREAEIGRFWLPSSWTEAKDRALLLSLS